MIELTAHPEGVVLSIRAQPGARKDRIVGEYGGALKVAVTAPPEDGRANAALIDLLRESFHLKRAQVMLISGATSRDKKFLLRGMTRTQLHAILDG